MARQIESAVFIDLESAAGGSLGPRRFEAKKLIEIIEEDFDAKIRIANAYADFRHHSGYIEKLHLTGIEAVQVTGYEAGKQSVDMRICCDALITAYEQPSISRFIILANDTDYVPVVRVLRKMGKSVYLLCKKDREYIEAAYATFCDRIVDYANLLSSRTASDDIGESHGGAGVGGSAAKAAQRSSRKAQPKRTSPQPAELRTLREGPLTPGNYQDPVASSPPASAISLQKAQSALLEILAEQGGPLLGSQILPRLRRKLGQTFDFSDVQYGSAKDFILSFPHGDLVVDQAGSADITVSSPQQTANADPTEERLAWIMHNARLVTDYHFTRDAQRRHGRLAHCHGTALEIQPFTRAELVGALCEGAGDMSRTEANDYFSVLTQSGCLDKLGNETPSRFALTEEASNLRSLTLRYEASIVYKCLAFLDRVGRSQDWALQVQAQLFGREQTSPDDEQVLRSASDTLAQRRSAQQQDGSDGPLSPVPAS